MCYDIPDARDWTIWNVEITAGSQKAQAVEMVLIKLRQPAVDGQQTVMTLGEGYLEPDENNGAGLRCDLVRPLELLPTDQPVTLRIDALMARPSEGGVCEPAYLERVNALLATRDPALRADCFIHVSGGGGSSGLQMVAWPNTMSELEAQAVMDYDFFLDLNGIRGPWVFKFQFDD